MNIDNNPMSVAYNLLVDVLKSDPWYAATVKTTVSYQTVLNSITPETPQPGDLVLCTIMPIGSGDMTLTPMSNKAGSIGASQQISVSFTSETFTVGVVNGSYMAILRTIAKIMRNHTPPSGELTAIRFVSMTSSNVNAGDDDVPLKMWLVNYTLALDYSFSRQSLEENAYWMDGGIGNTSGA